MSRNYKFHNPNGVYFVSFAEVEWIDVFTRIDYCSIILDALRQRIETRSIEVLSWCIMSNHVRLIFRSLNHVPPEKQLGRFKQYTSNQIVRSISQNPNEGRKKWMLRAFAQAGKLSSNVRKNQFWRHDNKPVELWNLEVAKQKIDYIHMNPVKAGIVLLPEHYAMSSAIDYAGGNGLLNIVFME